MEKNALTVVKFGGTSVASAENRARAIGHIRTLRQQGMDVVAVVSAMGRRGQPYATDTLLELVGPDCAPATRDLLMSCGETLSACVLADQLSRSGIHACAMTGPEAGLRTDGAFSAARVTGMDPQPVRQALEQGLVPVIAGFQGAGPDGRVTTLGRGGSDTSAVEIGGYLGAAEVVIFTDVPGVAKADPRIWPEAPYIKEIDSGDMLALARWGAGVIHPRAVEAGVRHGVPVRVRSTFDGLPGTVIRPLAEKPGGFIGAAMLRRCGVSQKETGFALPGCDFRLVPESGKTAVITVLCRPLGEPSELLRGLPAGAEVFREGELVHLLLSDAEVSGFLRVLCRRLACSD